MKDFPEARGWVGGGLVGVGGGVEVARGAKLARSLIGKVITRARTNRNGRPTLSCGIFDESCLFRAPERSPTSSPVSSARFVG